MTRTPRPSRRATRARPGPRVHPGTRALTVAVAGALVGLVLLVGAATATAAPARTEVAQTGGVTTTTGGVFGGTTETTSAASARDAQIVHDSENSPVGVVVVVVIVLIIVGGAGILYLRNRRPAPK